MRNYKSLAEVRIEINKSGEPHVPRYLYESYTQYLFRSKESHSVISAFRFVCALRAKQKIAYALEIV